MKKLTFVAIAALTFFSATAQEGTSTHTTTHSTTQVAPVEVVQEEADAVPRRGVSPVCVVRHPGNETNRSIYRRKVF